MNKQLLMKLNGMRKETLLSFVEAAKDYALYKGIYMRDSRLPRDARIHLPFCLIPSEFPREWFEYVYNLQESINLILHKIAYSKEILKECLSSIIEADEFTRNIFNIFENVFDNLHEQTSLTVIRSDYLLSCDSYQRITGIKQVENNTIAVGLGGISPLLRDLYRLVLEKLEWREICNLPENKSNEEMAKAMIAAWRVYGAESAVFLFVVEESTFNISDQRLLEYRILEHDKHLEVLRCTFKDLRTNLVLKNKKLYVYDKEVAVVYFRVGYAPEHYEPEDWTTRLLIEQSRSIKCPSVGFHLAGTKTVQFYLSQEGVLEKFVDSKKAEKLRRVFAKLYSFNMGNRSEIVSKAIENPNMFILKQEREGGGNNLHGLDISNFLKTAKTEEKNSYILMERIHPPELPNYIIQSDGIPNACLVNNELGIFGVILGNKNCILKNKAIGHLLRSKPNHLSEGGVASGRGALNYPYLV